MSLQSILPWLILSTLTYPLLLSLLGGRRDYDPLSPLAVFAATYGVMFVIRARYGQRVANASLRGSYDTMGYLDRALLFALMGAVAFEVSYLSAKRNIHFQLLHEPQSAYRHAIHIGAPSVVVGLVATAYSFGRGLSTADSAYIYYLPLLTIPGCLLINLALTRGDPRLSRLALLVAAPFILSYLVAGQRAFVLFMVAALAVMAGWRRKHLGLRARSVVIILLTGYAVMTRTVTDWLQGGPVETPTNAITEVVSGGTTEMLPAFAVQLASQGELRSLGPRGYLESVLVHWIPRGLWPEKPVSYAEGLYAELFPSHYAVSRANVQFSILGDFYSAGGAVGVVIGMALFGLVVRRIYAGVLGLPAPVGRLVYASMPMMIALSLRGDLALNLGIALFLFAPIVIYLYMARGSWTGEQQGSSSTPTAIETLAMQP